MELLGLLAELKVMFCDSKEQVSQYFIKKLTENAPESSRRARGALFSDRQPLEAVRKDPRAWSLAFDLLLSLQKNEEVELFVSKMFESGVISTELAVYVSSRLHQVGDNANAVKVMERSLALSKSNPLALLFLVSQYFSCMCSTGTMNIHRFREVYISAEEVMLPALREEPNFTVSFFMDCAALESRIGLGGNAELITLKLTMAAANTLRSSPSHDRLLEGMVETAICLKFKFRGIKEVRELCKTLINARDNPTFTARVAVQWASLENRMNNVEQARYVLRACAPTQNPDTAPEFWEFWESLCSTATEFEEVARKRKQVSIEFNNSA
ncbi:hypothetical protein AGDE_09479 [Angomonas deanei]|uniref:Pre-mRNA-splicing factor Syf1/CRNKL1-like C-terminal HAT-repeats domain-containing protein n=1 Tax=Angomonas deanei TaxID=59799 RepID=A0A7G2CLX5_9TRYP|nr:hypothetical protein AGDE_09479 [Angomonas deanei]CAD2220826.1 hypothetical protein, conserved [Angomonas deanei]|eukprot:EPY30367.1 hypothetical protein AGDE_09479 [Angomonas deanei]